MIMTCCNNKNPVPMYAVPPFIGFTEFTPILPKLYWDTYSQEQRIHRICELLEKIACYCDLLGTNINETNELITALAREFQDFKEHGFDDYYKEQVAEWVAANLEYIVTHIIRSVYFGLTLDGHFVAYIPQSWNDIVFDTGAVYGQEDYGRLILKMDVDSPYSVEQP